MVKGSGEGLCWDVQGRASNGMYKRRACDGMYRGAHVMGVQGRASDQMYTVGRVVGCTGEGPAMECTGERL